MAAGIERFRAEAQSFGMECDPASRRGGWGSQEGMPPHLYYELFQDSHSTLQAHAVGGYGSFTQAPSGFALPAAPRFDGRCAGAKAFSTACCYVRETLCRMLAARMHGGFLALLVMDRMAHSLLRARLEIQG